MTPVHFASEPLPAPDALPWLPTLAALVTKAAAMGLLAGAPVTDLGPATVQRLVQALQQHGIGAEAGISLAPLTRAPQAPNASAPADATPQRLLATLHRLHEALEASAAPAVEWPAMRELLGDELLTQLLQVAPSSLRRYAAAERPTPDDVAARLHWLALTAADLAGAYNPYGIRRWFERPRAQLNGASPRQHLQRQAGTRRWHPDDPAAQQVRALAATLSDNYGAGPALAV